MNNIKEKESKEIDLVIVLNFLKRNKRFIFIGTIISLFSSALISLLIPKTWQGEFQIVLQKKSQGSSSILRNFNNNGTGVLGFLNSSNNQDINTQITILKSPSVLMPVFEFIKLEKTKKGEDSSNLVFKRWLNGSLKVDLEEGTKVLNLSFRDKDKNLILPTLELISKTYQQYNGNERIDNLKSGVSYLDKEIKDYKEKNKLSQQKLVEYSLKNDLELPDILKEKLNPQSEKSRSLTINKIKLIDQQILSLNKIKSPKETLKFISIISGSLNDKGLTNFILEIENLNQKANSKASLYRDSYIEKYRKLLERNINILKKEILKSLVAKKEVLIDRLESLSRPIEQIIIQRDLLLNAKLELQTIQKLQSDRRILALEVKKILPPWELITKPTLLEVPIQPRKKRFTLIGGSIGFSLFSILCYLKELKTKFIYEEEIFSQKIGKKLLINFRKSSENIIKIFFENLNKEKIKNKKKYGFLIVGFLDKNSSIKFNNYLNNYLTDDSLIIDDSLNNIDKFDELILVTNIGKVTINQLDEAIKIIEITKLKITGFINI